MKTVLCMKWGTKYGPDYVNWLARGVARHLGRPYRFLCLTEDATGLNDEIETAPLPDMPLDARFLDRSRHEGTWRKIAVFRPGLADLAGPVLFLDLDVVVAGPLDRLFAFERGRFCIIRDWLAPRRERLARLTRRNVNADIGVNSSVFRFEAPRHGYVFDHLVANQAWANINFRIEQKYLGAAVGDRAYWPGEWVVSFKRECRPAFPLNLIRAPQPPADASVIVFHGHPLPDEAIAGYRSSPLRASRPAPWLAKHWR